MAEFSHKSDIGGVKLNINSAEAVAQHYTDMATAIRAVQPDITEIGMTVEPMFKSSNGRELMFGVVRDPIFGPAISFGLGGTMVEIFKDNAIALPPLNTYMIEQMISKTKAGKYLKAFRNLPPANSKALIEVLLNISTLVSELPELLELDINPLIVDEKGAIAVDARIKAQISAPIKAYKHMAIHPYPHELIQHHLLSNGMDIIIRPIRPEDAELEQDFHSRLSANTKYFRFMQALQELTPEMIVRFTQIDYDREMAFIAITNNTDLSHTKELAVGRYVMSPDGKSVEFALVVVDDAQCMGIGTKILIELMRSAKDKGMEFFTGEVLTANKPMLGLVSKLGFSLDTLVDNAEVMKVTKKL